METKGLFYFAHPYTCKDKNGIYVQEGETANFLLCNLRASELVIRGYNVYSPISHTHPIHISSPLLLSRREHKLWYVLDNEVIARTNWSGIILAPNWETSTGCVNERKQFEERGLPILLYENLIQEPILLERNECIQENVHPEEISGITVNKYQEHYNSKNNLASMPKEYIGRFFNGGCTDPCDMLQGPCTCGASHHQEEWPADIQLEVFGNISGKKTICKRKMINK